MHMRTLFHAVLATVALLALAACRPEGAEAPVDAARAAKDAANAASVPDFEFPSLVVTTVEGDRYDLADRRGRWVVVNFWATWCAPCIKEMPELSALDAMREHIEVIGLAYEDISVADLQAFLERRPVAYPVAVVDVYDPPADFATPRGLPVTYLIAPDGRMAQAFLGPVTAAELEEAIAAAGGTGAPSA